MRIDIWLVEQGHAPSRQKAQELIATGRVVAKNKGGARAIGKPSTPVTPELATQIEILANSAAEFVSRGGQKLLGAAQTARVDFKNKSVLDVGISTGGFTDCAFYLGAKKVVGVDVGHGQLAAKLKKEPRLAHFEGINARDLAQADVYAKILKANEQNKFDVIVIDVSFISLKLIVPAVAGFIGEAGHLLALVKPQFEVGRDGLGRGGIVKDAKLFPVVESSIKDVCASVGLKVESYFDSSILGSDGNREFFIHATIPQLGLF